MVTTFACFFKKKILIDQIILTKTTMMHYIESRLDCAWTPNKINQLEWSEKNNN